MLLRNDWTLEEIHKIYFNPLLDLVFQAASVHRKVKNFNQVQVSSLISVKTGGCPEDCSYCPQAARYHTDIEVEALLSKEKVLKMASDAKKKGASRMCLGAAWREVRDNRDFDKILDMVRSIRKMDMEVCCTLGMLTASQALKLKQAGLYAYNHNIDTSADYYQEIISTRNFQDRLDTINNVRKAGITVCCGGIIGMGEKHEDRIAMLHILATLPHHPESVPINALVPVKGTPLADKPRVSIWDMLRMVSTARIIMPHSVVRLSAGRNEMSMVEQAFCFMAGANSIFAGEKLLTTPNPQEEQDKIMFDILGLEYRKAFHEQQSSKN